MVEFNVQSPGSRVPNLQYKILHSKSHAARITRHLTRLTHHGLRFRQHASHSALYPKLRASNLEPRPTGYWLLTTDYSSRGFTLIEIMVVVFILGLLVTLVAPKVMGRTEEAKRTKAAADLRAVQQALNLYRLDNGGYPTTDQGLQALVTKPQSGTIPRRWNSEGYLEKVQTDPWGHPYIYISNGDHYTLKSFGADGEEGGEGKYADLDSGDL
jgi:general secretion pathway protein G